MANRMMMYNLLKRGVIVFADDKKFLPKKKSERLQ